MNMTIPKVEKMLPQHNLQRDTLRKLQGKSSNKLIPLRLEYSEKSKLLTGYINKLVNVNRIYPTHLPTQASFRWSTINPPITNWPRQCICTDCPKGEHEWTDKCWSVRDILLADSDEVLVSWDHDNIEGKIHDIIVDDEAGIQAHKEGYDLHTITCCNIFGYTLPQDLRNPHTAEVDTKWRAKYNWQGKDTKQRVLAKNFNHGSKYTKTYRFVHKIDGIEKYGITKGYLEDLAKKYIASKGDAWGRKLDIMAGIQKRRIARTLYGGRRVFFDSSEETGREGFSHMISGTVSDYNNETLNLLHTWLGDDIRLLHNAHDGDKTAVKRNVIYKGMPKESDAYKARMISFKEQLKQMIERPITYNDRSLIMTAGVKIHA